MRSNYLVFVLSSALNGLGMRIYAQISSFRYLSIVVGIAVVYRDFFFFFSRIVPSEGMFNTPLESNSRVPVVLVSIYLVRSIQVHG